MDKSTAYDFGGMEGRGLFFTKEKFSHSHRRRQWARGFNKESLNFYQSIVKRRTMELMSSMMSRKDSLSSVVDMSECIDHWAYDIMQLVEELDKKFPGYDPSFTLEQLMKLPYLNAVIHEALRLGTPFGGFPRVVPKGGILIKNKFIPEHTIVSIPTYTQQISEENFSPHPLHFKPERWLPNSTEFGFRTNRNALMAFSYGKGFEHGMHYD
ncbi:hypothetical protein HHX47_DHR4000590 [Lentinula edodes]|nr:hypothetical protein HHX47_DHR4000590 [Lentinula edodes]